MSIVLIIGGAALLESVYLAIVNCGNYAKETYSRIYFRNMQRNRRKHHYFEVIKAK